MPGFATGGDTLTNFTDARPGSVIQYSGLGVFNQEATVLEMKPEFGPTAIPALVVQPKGTTDTVLLTANGDTKIKILLDARSVASDDLPQRAVQARLRPRTVTAIQFTGGAGIATDLIRWLAGKVAVQYRGEDNDVDEALILTFLGNVSEVRPGDWVVQDEEGGFRAINGTEFVRAYDVVPSVI